MKSSQEVIDLIKESRKLLTTASFLWNGYKYIGYSHLISIGDGLSNVESITKKEAVELLKKDIKKIEKQLNKHIEVEITQNQFDALVSLVYDIGIKAFISSGMLDSINRKDFAGTLQHFRYWMRYKKKPIYQLIKSRKMEIRLFEKPVNIKESEENG